MLMPNGPAAWIGLEYQAQAGVHCPASACATGAEAIALGLDIIRSGRADVVLAGGTEAVVHPLPIAGFAAMRAMSTRNDEPERASRPFDKGRDGFILGEGSGVIVLERADHAAARGARVYARLAGAGITSDGFDIVQPDPQGRGSRRAIAAALRDAELSAKDIAHVNAHATSTPVGDLAEIVALREAVGVHPVVSSTKSMHGHLLGRRRCAGVDRHHPGDLPRRGTADDQPGRPGRRSGPGRGRQQGALHGGTGGAEQLVRLRRAQRGTGLHPGLTRACPPGPAHSRQEQADLGRPETATGDLPVALALPVRTAARAVRLGWDEE